MDNCEVAHFVEHYRHKAMKEGYITYNGKHIDCTNSTIARLLCKEARVRWLSIADKEEVYLDDITCVVMEFLEIRIIQNSPAAIPIRDPTEHLNLERIGSGSNTITDSDSEDESEADIVVDLPKRTIGRHVSIIDARRGSITTPMGPSNT